MVGSLILKENLYQSIPFSLFARHETPSHPPPPPSHPSPNTLSRPNRPSSHGRNQTPPTSTRQLPKSDRLLAGRSASPAQHLHHHPPTPIRQSKHDGNQNSKYGDRRGR